MSIVTQKPAHIAYYHQRVVLSLTGEFELPRKKRSTLSWFLIAILYFACQAILYAQDRSAATSPATPWEHLTLEGALLLAVGQQYRENRSLQAANMKLATDSATALANATAKFEAVVNALERVSERVSQALALLNQRRD